MRIMHCKTVRPDGDRLLFRATGSRPLTLTLMVLGALGLLTMSLWRVRTKVVPDVLTLVVAPSMGALLVGALLHCYDTLTEIDIGMGTVVSRERFALLPLRTQRWELSEFKDVRAMLTVSGREGAPGSYYTITLRGARHKLALFDVDDLTEARRIAADLQERLGLPGK